MSSCTCKLLVLHAFVIMNVNENLAYPRTECIQYSDVLLLQKDASFIIILTRDRFPYVL